MPAQKNEIIVPGFGVVGQWDRRGFGNTVLVSFNRGFYEGRRRTAEDMRTITVGVHREMYNGAELISAQLHPAHYRVELGLEASGSSNAVKNSDHRPLGLLGNSEIAETVQIFAARVAGEIGTPPAAEAKDRLAAGFGGDPLAKLLPRG